MTPRLAQDGAEDAFGQLAEWRTKQRCAVPPPLCEDAFGVTQPAKSFDAVLHANLTSADPAKRQVVLRDVHDRAIAGCRAVEHLALCCLVVPEIVERQGRGRASTKAIASSIVR